MVWCANCCRNVPAIEGDGRECCGLCGRVLQEVILSDDPQFAKGADGSSFAAGQKVAHGFYSSREKTLSNAKTSLKNTHDYLGIDDFNDDIADIAFRFYQVALERGFTKTRRRDLVLSSCLYLACRVKKRPFLLIDFSHHLKVDVFVLGSVYLQLCHKLYLPPKEHEKLDPGEFRKLIDPSVYIDKFNDSMFSGIDSKTAIIVKKCARNILASMNRDWMQTGRNPSGLCGAALYISALSHGLNISKSDIRRILHMCEATLTKRLIEFENTDAGGLTIDELTEKEEDLRASSSREVREQFNTASKPADENEVLCKHSGPGMLYTHGLCRDCYDEFMEVSGGLEGGFDPPAFQRAEKERLGELSTEEAAYGLLRCSSIKRQEFKDLVPTTEAIDSHQVPNDETPLGEDPVDGSLNLAGIDDDEVEGYIHNDEEQRYKKIIWEKLNWEYLQEEAAKKKAKDAMEAAAMACNSNASEDEVRAAKELAEAAAAAVAKTRKEKQQKRAAEAKNAGPAQSAVEAARDMLSKKRGSSKINLDALKGLFKTPQDETAEGVKKQRTEADSDVEDSQNGGAEHDMDNQEPEYGGETYGDDLYMDEPYDYENNGYDDEF